MDNSMYIVKGIDKAFNDYQLEYEFYNLSHARHLYNSLKTDKNIDMLMLYEYNFTTRKYYLMEG